VCHNREQSKIKNELRREESVQIIMSEENTTAPAMSAQATGESQEATTPSTPAAATEATPSTAAPEATSEPAVVEEITYHAVEKDGQVTAIWEMQGRKHVRTIDPRSRQGQDILRLYTAEHHDDPNAVAPPPAAAASE
jgi:hypothetical protein